MKITRIPKRSLFFRPWRITVSYAHPEGGPLLKNTPHSWRHINGFALILPRSQVWIEFRRYTKDWW